MGQKQGRQSRQRSTSFELQGISGAQQKALWLRVLGVILLVRGGMFLLNPQLAMLTCDRLAATGMCQMSVASLRGETTIPIPIDTLETASVQKQGKLSQLVLVTSEQSFAFPINNGFSSTHNQAAQINAFLQDSVTPTLHIQQDNRWLVYPLAASLIAIGSFSLWGSPRN